jgi:predicted unusual protein kinase regulating ubiquinone biosynthesis (AarF/ABC1/UbiB family)
VDADTPPEDPEPVPAGIPPRGRLARTARLAALPAAYAGRSAIGLGRRIGGQPAELVAEQLQRGRPSSCSPTLGQLKGGAMKVGQAMSAMEAALPEALVGPYREALVQLQDAGPGDADGDGARQLDRSFPAGWRRLLRDFDDRPVASASIGQVHRAVWEDGTPVAVKVQYPGAGDALVADLSLLDRLAPVLRPRCPGWTPGSCSPSCASGWSRRSTTSRRRTRRPPSPTPTATTRTSASRRCSRSRTGC